MKWEDEVDRQQKYTAFDVSRMNNGEGASEQGLLSI